MKENNKQVIVSNINTFSHYSLLSSTLSVDDIINFAIQNNQNYVSLTDNNLYCAIEFYKKAKNNNLKPIIGLDINYYGNNIIIIAKNFDGYKNLIKISSNVMKKIDFSIDDYLSNTFVVNKINSNFKTKKTNVYSLDKNLENRIAINESRYIFNEDKKIYNAMKAIMNNQTISSILDLEVGDDFHFLTMDEFNKKFDEVEKTNLFNEIKNIDIVIPLNQFNLIKFKHKGKETSKILLKKLCNDGLNQKIKDKIIDSSLRKKYEERIEYELDIIDSMKFNDYFLIVQDFINESKSRNILVGPGRGSVAGSLVAYVLGITEVDSIKYDLVFERFLNPNRISMPDIDIDIMDTRRNEIISYIFDKYGYDHVAHIITFQRIKSKMAIRDVGRILDIDLKIINKISKLIPSDFDENLVEAVSNVKELKSYQQEFPELFFISSKLIGSPRQTGLHAAGIVLSEQKLDDIVPTQYGVGGGVSTQFSMDFLEELGLLKMDLLGLTNLSTISNIKKLIKNLHNIDLNLNTIDLNDNKVFDYLSDGHTIGIFQLESPGMTNLVKKIKPKSIEDISLCSALFRPGPQQNIPSFIARRNNLEKINYVHDSLKEILKPTNGIIVYQEQVINIVKKIGNFSAIEADNFRRIISKKYGDELEEFRKIFEDKALKNNYSKKEFNEIYNYVYTFANYGFNHSHSISYSLISYWLAYLKYYYPIEFMITLMSTFEGSIAKMELLINECQRLKIDVLPPSINISKKNFCLYNKKILIGFNSVKGIGEETSKKIINARELIEKKKFSNYVECVKVLSNSGIGKSTIETLIYAGMFDVFEKTRTYMLENLDEIISVSKQIKADGNFLFEPILKDIDESKEDIEKLNQKFIELIGYDFNTKKIEKKQISLELSKEVKEKLSKYTILLFEQIDSSIAFADCLVKIKSVKKTRTKAGKDMAFISMIDLKNKEMNVACFNAEYVNYSFEIDNSWYVVLIKTGDRGNQFIKIKEKF